MPRGKTLQEAPNPVPEGQMTIAQRFNALKRWEYRPEFLASIFRCASAAALAKMTIAAAQKLKRAGRAKNPVCKMERPTLPVANQIWVPF